MIKIFQERKDFIITNNTKDILGAQKNTLKKGI